MGSLLKLSIMVSTIDWQKIEYLSNFEIAENPMLNFGELSAIINSKL